jgi:hypothetical protein
MVAVAAGILAGVVVMVVGLMVRRKLKEREWKRRYGSGR